MKSLLTGIGIGIVFFTGWLLLASNSHGNRPLTANDLPGNSTLPSSAPTGLPQQVRAVNLNGSFSFAGEEIPVATNQDVRERLDLELMRNAYFHRNTLLLLKRTTRFFPTIERILAEEGVPDDLKFLAVAESGLANPTSPAGARGYWQFLKSTGANYGLEINSEVDERLHLKKATRAACRYLKTYHAEFGDWRWVAAAYNMGGPNTRKWKARQQAETVFDLDINAETMAYLFRIVALKTILQQPGQFGYALAGTDYYPPYNNFVTVKVNKSIPDLADFATSQGISYRQLKIYNPWLVSSSLTVRPGKSYDIRIPQQ